MYFIELIARMVSFSVDTSISIGWLLIGIGALALPIAYFLYSTKPDDSLLRRKIENDSKRYRGPEVFSISPKDIYSEDYVILKRACLKSSPEVERVYIGAAGIWFLS